MKLIKGILISLSAAAMAASISAQAAINIDPGPGTYTFETTSNIQLTQYIFGIPFNANCMAELTGDVYIVPGTPEDSVVIEVHSGSVDGSSGFPCNSVVMNFSTPWVATVAESGTPSPRYGNTAPLTFTNVSVTPPFGATCSGSVPVTFGNGASSGDPSFFTFTNASIGSSCEVSGTFYAIQQDVDVWH